MAKLERTECKQEAQNEILSTNHLEASQTISCPHMHTRAYVCVCLSIIYVCIYIYIYVYTRIYMCTYIAHLALRAQLCPPAVVAPVALVIPTGAIPRPEETVHFAHLSCLPLEASSEMRPDRSRAWLCRILSFPPCFGRPCLDLSACRRSRKRRKSARRAHKSRSTATKTWALGNLDRPLRPVGKWGKRKGSVGGPEDSSSRIVRTEPEPVQQAEWPRSCIDGYALELQTRVMVMAIQGICVDMRGIQ